MTEAYISPSDASLEGFEIESPNGKKLDITDLIVEFNIYESLSAPALRGDISLLDAAALYANLPLMGQEKITGTIVRGDVRTPVTFYTTTIEDIKNVNDFTMTYVINLVEESFFNNAISLISQSYEGSASEIATSVAEEFLGVEMDADPSNGNYRLIVPNWNPLYVLRWLTQRAVGENNIPFVCFSTWRNGLKFKSLKTLFDQEVVDEYYYNRRRNEEQSESAIQEGDASMARETVQTAEIFYPTMVAPTIDLLQKGAYGSTNILADILYKTVDTSEFNYESYYQSGAHLSKKSAIHPNFRVNGQPVSEHVGTRQNVFFHSSKSFGDSHSNFNATSLDTVPFRVSYLETLKNFQYKLGIKGRSDIEVGKNVNLILTKNRIADENNTDEIIDDR